MRFPAGTVTFAPETHSGAPYTGVVSESGDMLAIGSDVYIYSPALGGYSYQEPGPPPGDWRYMFRVADSGPLEEAYLKGFAAASEMKLRISEGGSWATS